MTLTESEGLSVSRHGEIADLVIDRPGKRNAISFGMWEAIPGIIADLERDDGIKVVVVRGAGSHFSAGADISEFETRRADTRSARIYNECVARTEHSLVAMRKPTIAVIQGFCIGGGCELALSCDLRFAGTTARMGITPAKLGIVYGFSATRQLVNIVGPSYAKYLLYSGNQVDAAEALRVRLVDQVFADDDLLDSSYRFAATVCSRSQVSVRGAKTIIGKISAGEASADAEARDLPVQAIESADYAEGVRAFLEKRPPRFSVR